MVCSKFWKIVQKWCHLPKRRSYYRKTNKFGIFRCLRSKYCLWHSVKSKRATTKQVSIAFSKKTSIGLPFLETIECRVLDLQIRGTFLTFCRECGARCRQNFVLFWKCFPKLSRLWSRWCGTIAGSACKNKKCNMRCYTSGCHNLT
jgi:hypothetical protein